MIHMLVEQGLKLEKLCLFSPQIQRRAAKTFICEISMGDPIGYNGSNLPLREYTQRCSLVRQI